MRVLIAPVGEQPTPNLIPLFAAKPEERSECVQFLVSDNERIKKVADHLCEALNQDPQTAHVIVPEAQSMSAWNLENARSELRQVVDKYQGDEVTVNLTGGTKIMSLAAYLEATSARRPMIYVNTERGEMLRFDGSGNPLAPSPLQVKIPIETQLWAAGQRFKRNPKKPIQTIQTVPADRAAFVKRLVANYPAAYEQSLGKIIGQIKNEAKRQGVSKVKCQIRFSPTNAGRETIQQMENMGLVLWNKASNLLGVAHTEAWEFLDGGWVETYSLVHLSESGFFDKVLGNVEVEDFEGELDVVVSLNGRLGIVECKTKGTHGEGATFIASKLRQHEAIFGGTYARALLALASRGHFRDIEHIAEQYGIGKVIFGEDLRNLAREMLTLLRPS